MSVILCRVSCLFNFEIYSLASQVITTTFNEQQSFNAVDNRFYFENVHSYNEQNGHLMFSKLIYSIFGLRCISFSNKSDSICVSTFQGEIDYDLPLTAVDNMLAEG